MRTDVLTGLLTNSHLTYAMPLQPPGEAPPESHQEKIGVVADALRRRSEKDGPRSLSLGDSDAENNRRIMADMILRGAALYQNALHKEQKAGWKQALFEEMEPRVPDFARRDFEEAFDLIISPSYRDFFLFCAEEGPMPDELWEALRVQEEGRSTTIPIEKLLGATKEQMTKEEVLEVLETELSEFFELLGYDEKTGEVEVRMQSKMREDVGSALAQDLGAPTSPELVEVESKADSSDGGLPELDFEAAATYAKQHEATAVLGLLSELRDTVADSPSDEQEKKRDELLRSLTYPVRRRLLGKPSTLEMSQDPPHELGTSGDAIERYAGALRDIGAPRPRYYAEQLAKEYPDRTITDAEPHPTRSGQVLTLSGEEAPKVTVLGES
jgi:hypothetical protein